MTVEVDLSEGPSSQLPLKNILDVVVVLDKVWVVLLRMLRLWLKVRKCIIANHLLFILYILIQN